MIYSVPIRNKNLELRGGSGVPSECPYVVLFRSELGYYNTVVLLYLQYGHLQYYKLQWESKNGVVPILHVFFPLLFFCAYRPSPKSRRTDCLPYKTRKDGFLVRSSSTFDVLDWGLRAIRLLTLFPFFSIYVSHVPFHAYSRHPNHMSCKKKEI